MPVTPPPPCHKSRSSGLNAGHTKIDLRSHVEPIHIPISREALDAAKKSRTQEWLSCLSSRLQTLSPQSMRRETHVVVIDSGCMKPPGEFPQLAGYEDLVRGGTVCHDENGHGTEIVSLITSLSPTIKVQVKCIGDRDTDLEVGGQLIADVWLLSPPPPPLGLHATSPY